MKLTLELLTLLVILITGVIVAASVIVEQKHKIMYFITAFGLAGLLMIFTGLITPTAYSISPSPLISSVYSFRNFLMVYGAMFLDFHFYISLTRTEVDMFIPSLVILALNLLIALKFILSISKINIPSNINKFIGEFTLYTLSILLISYVWLGGYWLDDIILKILLTILIAGHIIYRLLHNITTSL
ncbi:MAG: hypothetical protein NZ908_02400 [Candidatus Micrarchaeota archaeon]|nr:hypothetical protein [Candidatus Micrarchaeota archaeon]MCX8154726.1 hypothetical protein [Candidatus Micrarchaeota archaeon]